MIRRTIPALALSSLGLVAVGCGAAPAPEPADAPAPEPAPTTQQQPVEAEGTLATPEAGGNALTYDPAAAPVGATLSATVEPGTDSTVFRFSVEGLQPNRGYAAHAHAQPCGPTGDAAGPHFQNEPDPAATPEQPSVDPAYANPDNEIWLDLQTDAQGAGESSAEVPFTPQTDAPASVIVHEAESTATAPGEAGTAGGRIACLDVPVGS